MHTDVVRKIMTVLGIVAAIALILGVMAVAFMVHVFSTMSF